MRQLVEILSLESCCKPGLKHAWYCEGSKMLPYIFVFSGTTFHETSSVVLRKSLSSFTFACRGYDAECPSGRAALMRADEGFGTHWKCPSLSLFGHFFILK